MKKTLFFLVAISVSMNVSSQLISSPFTKQGGSMNVYGVLEPASELLSYNRYLNSVCFIHRKSPTYVTSPSLPANAQSGAVIALIGKNGGTQWDSTLLYADPNNWARFPQGGFYNPSGNSNILNAYVVGTGLTMNSSNSINGNWYASKKITSVGTNSAGADQQFFSNIGPNFASTTSSAMTKHDKPCYSFSSTDDGMVRSLGIIANDINSPSSVNYGLRGAMLTRGSFNSGVFVWNSDSIIPPTVLKSDGTKQLSSIPYMAWNDAGTVGYIVMIGTRSTATGPNKGWQPLIYKTTNSGNTWILVNGIDFTSPGYDQILNSLDPVNANSTLTIPCFNHVDGIDLVVDYMNKLHIFTTLKSTLSSHNDSLAFTRKYIIGADSGFHWKFTNNKWPYLIDFTGDGTWNWPCTIIDSVGTQECTPPSSPTSTISFPWYSYVPPSGPNTLVDTYMRLQASRTYDGEYILYSWAETDTTLTTGNTKWNEFPNVKMKSRRIYDGSVSSNEYMISSPSTGFTPRVRDHAYFHYMSSTSSYSCTPPTAVTFTTYYSVSNNIATDSNAPVDHFMGVSNVRFTFPAAWPYACPIGTNEIESPKLGYSIYPNPSSGKIDISLKLEQANDIDIKIFNIVGQEIEQLNYKASSGENAIPMNLQNCKPGIYFVKVKAGNSESTQKLIIE